MVPVQSWHAQAVQLDDRTGPLGKWTGNRTRRRVYHTNDHHWVPYHPINANSLFRGGDFLAGYHTGRQMAL